MAIEPDFKVEKDEDKLDLFIKLLQAKSNFDKNPCSEKVNGKSCTDQGKDFGSLCQNCTNAWTSVSLLGNQTPQEAIDFARGVRQGKLDKVKRLDDLCDASCDKETIYGPCADQGIKLPDMCKNCRDYWVEASDYAGQTPEEAIEMAKKFRDAVLSYGSKMGIGGSDEEQSPN